MSTANNTLSSNVAYYTDGEINTLLFLFILYIHIIHTYTCIYICGLFKLEPRPGSIDFEASFTGQINIHRDSIDHFIRCMLEPNNIIKDVRRKGGISSQKHDTKILVL
jgi:hypothetical protein